MCVQEPSSFQKPAENFQKCGTRKEIQGCGNFVGWKIKSKKNFIAYILSLPLLADTAVHRDTYPKRNTDFARSKQEEEPNEMFPLPHSSPTATLKWKHSSSLSLNSICNSGPSLRSSS